MNYLSRPYQPEAPVQRGDLNVDFQVLNTLQTRYDANKAIVDQTLAQYEMLRGLRTSDNEYIANKLAQVKSQIDSYGNIRFEHKSTVDSLTKTLQNVLKDPIVRDAVQSKAIKDNYDASVAELKKKNRELYSDANYQYGLYQAGMQDYLAGKTNKLGSATYTPYKNLQETHLKNLKTIKELKGSRYVEVPGAVVNGVQTVVKKEIDGLTQEEIQSYFGYLLTPEDNKQIEINGWSKWSQSDKTKAEAKNLLLQTQSAKLNNLNTALNYYAVEKENGAKSQEQREEARRKYEETSKSIEQIKGINYNEMSPDAIAYNLERSSYLAGISNMAGAEWKTRTEVDPIWKASSDLEMQMQKLAIDREELLLKQQKEQREIDALAVQQQGEVTTFMKTDENLPEEIDAGDDMKQIYNSFNTTNKLIQENVKTVLENYTEAETAPLLAELNKKGIQYKNGTFSFIDEKDKTVRPLSAEIVSAYEASGLSKLGGTVATEISRLKSERSKIVNDIKQVETPALKATFDKNPDKYITDLFDLYKASSSSNIVPASKIFSEMWVNITGEELSKRDLLRLESSGGVLGDDSYFRDKLKTSLEKSPDKLRTLSKSTDELLKQASKDWLRNTFYVGSTLSENAKEETSKMIQQRTQQGLMTSIYSGFKVQDEKKREAIVNMIPNTQVEGAPFSTKETIEFSLDKDKNLIIQQRQADSKDRGLFTPRVSTYKASPNDTVYQTLINMVNIEGKSVNIPATKGFSTPVKKVRLETYSTGDRHIYEDKNNNISVQFQQDLQKGNQLISLFGKDVNTALQNAVLLSDKKTAEKLISDVLQTSKQLPKEQTQQIAQQISEKVNNYESRIITVFNPAQNTYDFAIEFKNNKEGKTHSQRFSSTDKLTPNANYLLTEFPEMFLTRNILEKVLKEQTAEEIQKLIETY